MASQHSGRLTIFQAAAVDDPELGHAAFRVLACLGTYSDKDGWCYPTQTTIAKRLRITRQAVGKSLHQLAELGYILIKQQYNDDGGMRACLYRLNLDRVSTLQPDVAPPQPDVDTPATSEVAPPATHHVAPPATSEVAPLTSHENRPKRTTQEKVAERVTLASYQPRQNMLDWVEQNCPGVALAVVLENWRDWHTAKGDVIRDYDASLRTWLRREPQRLGGVSPARHSPNGAGKVSNGFMASWERDNGKDQHEPHDVSPVIDAPFTVRTAHGR